MIVVDTSAVLAVLQDEPRAADVAAALTVAEARLMSAATYVELGIVVATKTGGAIRAEQILSDFDLLLAPVDEDIAAHALAAWERFGRGRHPAALNYGDCFSYALAEVRDAPLLFVGDDFARTPIRSVL